MTTRGIPIPAARMVDAALAAVPLIVVASYRLERHMTRDLIRRIGVARRHRPVIGGVESGVFLLAEAGLLTGSAVTAHWEDLEEFAAHYPDVDLRPDRYVIDGNRFTAGGAAPALDMMLQIIRLRQGAPLALDVAKLFDYESARRPESPPPPSRVRLIDGDRRVAEAVGLMEAHISQPMAVDEIARRVGISARHLQSLFRAALGVQPGEYYRNLRLAQARRQIIETRRPISEIAAAAGFTHLAVFTRAYTRTYGEGPRQSRRAGPASRAAPPE